MPAVLGSSSSSTNMHHHQPMPLARWVHRPNVALATDQEDESSTSSTIPVNGVHCQQLPLTPPAEKPSTEKQQEERAVRFDMDGTEAYDNLCVCKEDTADMWYTNEDYNLFRDNAMNVGRKLTIFDMKNGNRPGSYTAVLHRVMEACCNQEESSSGTNTNVGDDEQQHNDEVILDAGKWGQLQCWLARDPHTASRLGLERFSVRFLRVQRRERRKQATETVLAVQQSVRQQREQQRQSNHDDDGDAETIRRACERVTLPCKRFARIVAQAAMED